MFLTSVYAFTREHKNISVPKERMARSAGQEHMGGRDGLSEPPPKK